MKLLLLCLAILFVVAVTIGLVMLTAYYVGMLELLTQAALAGLAVRLSRRPH